MGFRLLTRIESNQILSLDESEIIVGNSEAVRVLFPFNLLSPPLQEAWSHFTRRSFQDYRTHIPDGTQGILHTP